MVLRYVTKAQHEAKKAPAKPKAEPLHQLHVDNEVIGDKSGYIGLILNKNRNGKAIRIANRFNEQRVYVLLSEVDNLIEALEELRDNGVPTSVKEIVFDTAA